MLNSIYFLLEVLKFKQMNFVDNLSRKMMVTFTAELPRCSRYGLQ